MPEDNDEAWDGEDEDAAPVAEAAEPVENEDDELVEAEPPQLPAPRPAAPVRARPWRAVAQPTIAPKARPKAIQLAEDPLDSARVSQGKLEEYIGQLHDMRSNLDDQVRANESNLKLAEERLEMIKQRIEAMIGQRQPVKDAQLRALRARAS